MHDDWKMISLIVIASLRSKPGNKIKIIIKKEYALSVESNYEEITWSLEHHDHFVVRDDESGR